MTTVTDLTTNPKYQFDDLRILIIEADSNNEVLAFVGKYSNPTDHFGQGLIDANNLWRQKDCPSVSTRNPSKRPDGYVMTGTTNIDGFGYTLMVSAEHLSIMKNEDFKAKVAPYGF
ncbi:hypothetical protein R3O67_30810 [Bacillus cereus]|uniref:hypothetical protein n=1 Tax=Bacillus cereus TaxID=1396 RepID=UPI003079E7DE